MPLSAKFDVDFTSFFTAVEKADAKMVDFETGAAKVERALSRMTDQFTGRRVVQEATLAAQAIENIGGVSTLTTAELKKVGATAQEAADKLTKLGEQVPDSIKKITDAYKQLNEEEAKRKKPEEGGFGAELGQDIVGTAAGMISAQAVMGAFEGTLERLKEATIDFAKESVKAYSEMELSLTKMTTALRTQGQATPEVIEQFKALAAQYEQTTVYSDDMVTKSEALLVQIGNVMPEEMDKALQAATDLASGLGIDLTTATELVAKAAAGHTETLGRYGIIIDQARVKSEGFGVVLEQIQKQFGGQAAAQLQTYGGQVQRVANEWERVMEASGKAIATSPIVQLALRQLGVSMGELADQSEKAEGGLGNFVNFLGQPEIATIIDIIEDRLSNLNETQKALAGLPGLKPPAPLPTMPTEGPGKAQIEIQNKLNDANDKWQKDAERITDQIRERTRTIADLQAAVDELSGSTVEGIKWMHDLGFSVEEIAQYYQVFEAQVEAVIELKDKEKKITEELIKVEGSGFGQIEAGLLGLSKAQQQSTQSAMVEGAAQAAKTLEYQKATKAILDQVDAAKKVNAERALGPGAETPGASALDKLQSELAAIEKQRTEHEKATAERRTATEARRARGEEIPPFQEQFVDFGQMVVKAFQDYDQALFGATDATKKATDGMTALGTAATKVAPTLGGGLGPAGPVGTPGGRYSDINQWSSLVPKAIEVRPITAGSYGGVGPVNMNVQISGIWDTRAQNELLEVLTKALRGARQLSAA